MSTNEPQPERLRQRARHMLQRAWDTSEATINRVLFRASTPSPLARYGTTILGISLVSVVIALTQTHQHRGLLALMYVLVVVLLAAAFGAGPAIAGAVLACLEYDFFFVPP